MYEERPWHSLHCPLEGRFAIERLARAPNTRSLVGRGAASRRGLGLLSDGVERLAGWKRRLTEPTAAVANSHSTTLCPSVRPLHFELRRAGRQNGRARYVQSMARGDSGSKPATNDPMLDRHHERARALTPAQKVDFERARAEALGEILLAKSAVTRGESGMAMMEIDLDVPRDFANTDWDSEDYAAGVRDGIAWARSVIVLEIGMATHDSDPSNQP